MHHHKILHMPLQPCWEGSDTSAVTVYAKVCGEYMTDIDMACKNCFEIWNFEKKISSETGSRCLEYMIWIWDMVPYSQVSQNRCFKFYHNYSGLWINLNYLCAEFFGGKNKVYFYFISFQYSLNLKWNWVEILCLLYLDGERNQY